ncbi:pilus assembly protein TadG-related protein [Zhongshania sp. BJYM1]|uniref:pilus assembly protein TadG-related protein n=1 Tax=Zhongshania aquatica TaxID=2965069 RepID=UPI0022B2C0F8|nr:pilus assembly protein TadG-related protein [Marortus sp. BJYM1]
MQMQRPQLNRSPQRQRGVTTILAVLMMLSLFTFLAVVTDTGRLYLAKRSLQKDADLAAMETALRYCRDQSLDVEAMTLADLDVLSPARNNFKGNNTNSTVTMTRVDNAVTASISYRVPASLFEQLLPSDDNEINLTASATAKACEPSAKLGISTNLLEVNLLNGVLGELLGTNIALTLASWQGLADVDINLLDFTNALASVGISVAQDGLITGTASVADILDVAATVLSNAGGDSAVAASILENEIVDQVIASPNIALGSILSVASTDPDSALDVGLNVLDLVKGVIYLGGKDNETVVDVPIALLGLADVVVKLQITEAPQFAIGNPELAKADPYGNNAIYVQTAQIKTFISLELPILGTLDSVLTNPLISDITDTANSLLSLNLIDVLGDILCLVGCVQEKDKVDIDFLSTPRVDIAVYGGRGEARVTDYKCDGGKSLDVDTTTSTLSVVLGQFGDNVAEAESNVFSTSPLVPEPLPILDIGSVHVKKTCVLAICSYQYKKGSGWTSDINQADRQAYTGGGIGLALDTEVVGDGPTGQTISDNPDATCLPGVKDELNFNCADFEATDPLSSLVTTLSGVQPEFYTPSNGNVLGTVTSLVGATANTLISTISSLISSTLSPILDPVLNSLLKTLGVSLANAEVGAALTCENDKVRLTN